MDFTKSCTSLMMCGNGEGEMLSPYVVYKSEHLWSTWTEGGPKGCRYNRTKSGWFDIPTFEDWFFNCLLPIVKKQQGQKVVIGDNLTSHINIEVLKACKVNQIQFVCLPAHSTHLTQPLDVAYFGPMKSLWRKILCAWKETESGRNVSNLPKDQFPKLLKKLIDELYESKKQNTISGFKKCGIYPLDRDQVLARLPTTEGNKNLVGESFIEHISNKRDELVGKNVPKKERKKLMIAPGKSISVDDVDHTIEEPTTGTSKPSGSLVKHGKARNTVSSSDSDSSNYSVHDDSCSDGFNLSEDSEEENVPDEVRHTQTGISNEEKLSLKEGDIVIVSYDSNNYPGMIIRLPSGDEEGPTVHCMIKRSKCWSWPQKKDVLLYKWCDVKAKICPPKLLNKRGHFSVPKVNSFS